MKQLLLVALAGASAVLAGAPSLSKLNRPRPSGPRIKSTVAAASASNVTTSENWSGAVLHGTGFTDVSAVVTVPHIDVTGAQANGTFGGTAWVGIDGESCPDAILQTGFTWEVTDGVVSYYAWSEWYPDFSTPFDDLTISPGDIIRMSVHAPNNNAGTATIENLTTGSVASQALSAHIVDDFDAPLCRTNAEWVVEDYEVCFIFECEFVPFADFGAVAFENATWAGVDGAGAVVAGDAGAGAAIIYNIAQNGTTFTDCAAEGETVTCKYV